MKRKGYGIQDRLLKWIENFIKDRNQRVQVDGKSSEWTDVTSDSGMGFLEDMWPFILLLHIKCQCSVLSVQSSQISSSNVERNLIRSNVFY